MTPCAGVAPAPTCPPETAATDAGTVPDGGFLGILNNYTGSGTSQTGTSAGQTRDEGEGDGETQTIDGGETPAEQSQTAALALMFALPLDPNIEPCAVEGGTAMAQDRSAAVASGSAGAVVVTPYSPTSDQDPAAVWAQAGGARMIMAASTQPGVVQSSASTEGAVAEGAVETAQQTQTPAPVTVRTEDPQQVTVRMPATGTARQEGLEQQNATATAPLAGKQEVAEQQNVTATAPLVGKQEGNEQQTSGAPAPWTVRPEKTEQQTVVARTVVASMPSGEGKVTEDAVETAAAPSTLTGRALPTETQPAESVTVTVETEAVQTPPVTQRAETRPTESEETISANPKIAPHPDRYAQGKDRAEAGTNRGNDGGEADRNGGGAGSTQAGATARTDGQADARGQAAGPAFREVAEAPGQTVSASGGSHGVTENSAATVSKVMHPDVQGPHHTGTATASTARPQGVVDMADRWSMRTEDLGRVVTGMILRGEKSLKVTLVPEHLGRITVSCLERNGDLQVVLHAANREARDLLTRQEDAVRSLMSENGFKLTQFDVREGEDENRRGRMDAREDPGQEGQFREERNDGRRREDLHRRQAVGAGGFWGIA